MAKPPLSRETESAFLERVQKLRADTPGQFGAMDPNKMLRHMRNALETSIGETNYPDKSIPVVRGILYFLVCNVITTWPGGKLKAPDFWSPPVDHTFDEEKALFLAATKRFLEALASNPEKLAKHPIFGELTLRQWSLLHGTHLHHHLRQFGV